MKKPDLRAFLKQKGSPLAGYVDDIYAAANRFRIDPRLIVAIAGAETTFGLAGGGPSHFNAWGIGPGISYGSWTEGINAAAKLLRDGYIGQGLKTIPQIQGKWAPSGAGNDPTDLNSNWTRNVSSIYSQLGGNPGSANKGWKVGASPALKVNAPVDASPWGDLSLPLGRPTSLAPPSLEGVVSGSNSISSLLWSMLQGPAQTVQNIGKGAAAVATGQPDMSGQVNLGGAVQTTDHLSPKMIALAKKFGLDITSGFRSVAKQAQLYAGRSGPGTVAAPGSSYHNMGRAIDVAVNQDSLSFVEYARKHPGQFREVFYDGGRGGHSVYIKNGVLYPGRILGGHGDHVHIAR